MGRGNRTESPTPTMTAEATPTNLPQLDRVQTISSAEFFYDGNGNMVKSIIDGVKTYYVGGYYESGRS